MSSIVYQADFPIGFAENREEQTSTAYYVEWLENSSEFPDLITTNTDLSGGNWELLQKKEIDHEDHTLVPLDDAWAKISSLEEDKHSYVEIAEKNANELKPSKRSIQPLWPHHPVKRQPAMNNEQQEDYYDDLYQDIDLFNAHKSQSKNANRSRHLRKMHNLRTTDHYVQGILRLATSHGHNVENPNLKYLGYQDVKVSNKAQALAFTAKFNAKKYGIPKDNGGVKNHKTDFGEYSVNDMITRR